MRLAAAPTAAPLSITVDGRYILYVNGAEQGRGPVRCSPLFQRYDDYDLAGALTAGDNVIAVLVHTYGRDTAFYETTKGMWQPTFGDGGLWTEGAAQTPSGAVSLSTHEGWRCIQSDAWTQDTPQSNHSLGFIEDFDAAALPPDWTELGFDDAAWDAARALIAGGGAPDATYGGLETRPFPVLLPRGIPMLETRQVAAKRIVWVRGLAPNPELPFHRRSYEEPLVEASANAVSGWDDLLKLEGGHAVIRTEPGRDTTILLDFGKIMTGRPWFEIEARGGEEIEIACAEGLPGEWSPDGLPADARPKPKPWLGADAHLCRYRAKPGVQAFERFEWCAIRWMQVTVRDAPEGVVFRGLGANLVNYPVEPRGRFASSDPVLDKLWATGAYTLRQCMHDAWEDCPSREQRQWLGDVTVENLAGWAAFGPSVAPLTAKYLAQAAESQRPDGLTQMFAPGDHKTDGLLDPRLDAAVDPLRRRPLALRRRPRDHRGDLPFDPEGAGLVRAAAGAAPGLVADLPYWHFMDWAGVGRHGEAGALNAQLAGAFAVAAELAGAVGWQREAARLAARGRGDRRGAATTRHWDARRGVYVDMVDPVTGAQQLWTSQHASAAIALWTDAPDRARPRGACPDRREPAPHFHRRAADRAHRRSAGAGGRRGARQHLLQPLRLRRAGPPRRLCERAAAHARALRSDAGARRDDAVGELRADRQPLPRLLGDADLPAVAPRAGRRARRARLRRDRAAPRISPTSTTPRASCRRRAATSRRTWSAPTDGFVARYRLPGGIAARAAPPARPGSPAGRG